MNQPPYGEDSLLTTEIASERDVFALRRYAKMSAEQAGMERQDQVRLATVLSELGRDLLRPTPLTAEFVLRGPDPAVLAVVLVWHDDRVPSPESLAAVARLLPRVSHRPAAAGGPAGGRIMIECPLPADPEPADRRAERIRRVLRTRGDSGTSLAEGLRAQSRDLMTALEESRAQHEELQRLNDELAETNQGVLALYTELSEELEETNRGVVALYAELDEKSRLLREASESKTRFWSNISHELRTPINSVIGLSRLVLDPGSDPLTAEQHRQVSLVSAAGNMLLALVNELLDVAKAEAGRLEPQLTSVDLGALLIQVRELALGAAPPGDVSLVVPDEVDPPTLVTDEVMLTRILRNLLSNGLKFTRHGEVRLQVRPDSGDRVLFTVSDTGVGIPEDQQETVFEEFYQVPGAHQRDRSGTGLGLPYARRLAELLGASLTLDSTPGQGTVVRLRLPAHPAAAPSRRLARLVAADDDPVFREVFRPVLEQCAERVVEVHTGTQVLDTVRRERPDGVLLDLQMPGTDGYDVLAQLAADPELCGIPVVVLTAADSADLAADRLTHARGVLSKHGATAHRIVTFLASAPAEGDHDASR